MTSFWRVSRWYGLSATLVLVCFGQLRWQAYFAVPLFTDPWSIVTIAVCLFLAVPAAAWGALAGGKDNARLKVVVVAFSLFAAGYCEVLHHWIVDLGRYDPRFANNLGWQLNIHKAVLRLEGGGAMPHSFRFLPDCIVAFFQWLSGSFDVARITYRLLANSLLFVMIYRYGRLYLTPAFAVAAIIVIAFFYPVTILRYAGQFTDPASHLSFVVCLYCLASGLEAGFQCSLFLGVLAKESIIAASICRIFYGKGRLKAAALAAVYFALTMALELAIRRYVNKAPIPLAFASISNTGSNELLNNLRVWRDWWATYAVTLGVLIPGAVAGWKLMDKPFRATCLVIVVATLGSNLAVSLFWEVRNIVPALIPLAIVNLRYAENLVLRYFPHAQIKLP